MGVGQIPFAALDAYAARYGIDDVDDFDNFRSLIRSMDGVFLKWSAERAKTKPPSGHKA